MSPLISKFFFELGYLMHSAKNGLKKNEIALIVTDTSPAEWIDDNFIKMIDMKPPHCLSLIPK